MKKQLLYLALLAAAICPPAQAGQQKILSVGDIFPAVTTNYAFTDEELAYFGVERGFFSLFTPNRFTVNEINSDIILVEFFNNYCSSCKTQAPVINQVYKAVQKNQDLSKKVRFIGIGAGNNEREVEQFRQQHEVPFPLVPDPRFSFYDAIGEPGGTPFIVILKKRDKDSVVVGTHLGLVKDSAFFISTLKTAAEKNVAELNRRVLEKDITVDDARKLTLNLSPKQQMELIAKSMSAASGGIGFTAEIALVRLPSGRALYSAQVDVDGKKLTLYSKIFSQKPLCDVCHGIHFIITFDSKGYIRDFTPIHITKYGNIDWDDYDIDNMRRQLIGKRLNKELIFDPTIDAVSSATMSSSLIYKGVNELHSIYKELD